MNRTHFRRVFVLLLLLAGARAHSECECIWQGSFTDVQAGTDLVASATVISSKGNSIDVSIDRPMRGAQPAGPVRIWLKAGDYCRPPVETFPTGSRWVMAVSEITEQVPGGFNPLTPNISYGRLGDFQLSSCGGYWLKEHDGRVTGNLVQAPRWQHNPKMTPVLVELVEDFVKGKLDADTLLQASQEDPALKELMLDTKAFLRNRD